MSEYTQTCPDCDECRRSFPAPVPAGSLCARCCSLESLLGDYLKSRAGRLRVHAMLTLAEIAAGCEQSREMMALVQGAAVQKAAVAPVDPFSPTQWTRPLPLDTNDAFTA